MSTNLLQSLKSIQMFSTLPEPFLAHLAESAQIRVVKAGSTVFCQGEPSPYCFGILSGEVKIQRVSRNRSFPSKTLCILGPGELFGESALFEESPRSAMASVSRDGQLLAIPGAQFREWLKKDTASAVPLLMSLLQGSLQNLRQTSRELSVIYGIGRLLSSSKPFKDRIAESLEFLRSSLDGVDEVLCYERSPYWEEFHPFASAPTLIGLPEIPLKSDLGNIAVQAGSATLTLSSPVHREAIRAAKLPWEHAAAVSLVPLPTPQKEHEGPRTLLFLVSYQNADLFSLNMRLLLSAVAQPLAEAIERHHRQEDESAQNRLSQSRSSFQI